MYLCHLLWLLVYACLGCDALVVPPFVSSSPIRSAETHITARQDASSRPNNDTLNQERADAVREVFTFAFNSYWEICRGHDELLPVTSSCSNPRNGWGASAIDALSTALIMEIQPIVNEILDYLPTIDFTTTPTVVSLFETTIRYLAGMLSAHDLLSGPLSNLTTDPTALDSLLAQSKSIANSLAFAFNTPSGIPNNNLFFTDHSTDGTTSNGLATIGSLQLEWQHLSDLTGDPHYGVLAQKAATYLLEPQPATAEPFPGLLGTQVNTTTGQFLDSTGGWNGGDDSFYEYLLKMYVYDSSRFSNYSDRWTLAADSTIKYLASHPSSRPDLTFLASFVDTNLVNASQHLTCFSGGNFILGGQVFDRQDYIDFGLELVNGCHDTYNSTATMIGPENFSWNTSAIESSQTDFYNEHGFYITDPKYDLRPEVIESYYYAFRATGNQMYRDWAWDAFVAINSTARGTVGFSSISDVNVPNGGNFDNEQESFFFAEVLKYSYLIQMPANVYDFNFNGSNTFVFNTEAHPFRVAGPVV